MAKEDNVLTEDFLFELYYACFTYDYVCSLVCEYMQKSYLPGRDFQALQGYLCKYFAEHKSSPTLNIISQIVSVNREVSALLEDIKDCAEGVEPEIILEQFENYLRQVKFQKTYKEIGELYAKQDRDKAMKLLQSFAEWQNDFSLRQNSFVDVVETFESRFRRNREKHNQESRFKPITRFYIDGLDEMNGGRDLRTQLTCLLAPTGVGKSHAARWIGKCASQIDGLNVLHFQLEGSEDEVVDAYAASLVSCNSYRYSTGTLKDRELERMIQEIKAMSGTLKVKSFPKFANQVSTIDIKNGIIMMISVLTFTVVGSYIASLLPAATMGSFSVFMTFLLGIKFIVRPVMTTKEAMQGVSAKKRAIQSMVCGIMIGLICGFVGAGGGMMMLLILTSVLGYELKTAVGTSVFIMAFTAFTGAVSHFMIVGAPDWTVFILCVVFTLIWARIAARFANKATPETLNRATGVILVILGIVVLGFSMLS